MVQAHAHRVRIHQLRIDRIKADATSPAVTVVDIKLVELLERHAILLGAEVVLIASDSICCGPSFPGGQHLALIMRLAFQSGKHWTVAIVHDAMARYPGHSSNTMLGPYRKESATLLAGGNVSAICGALLLINAQPDMRLMVVAGRGPNALLSAGLADWSAVLSFEVAHKKSPALCAGLL